MSSLEVSNEEFELRSPTHLAEEPQLALLPADRGKDAYLVLTAAFILEALVWGFPFAFGVFQDYYATHAPFDEDVAEIAAIGTSATGVMYLAAPLVYAVLRKLPRWRKSCSIFGFIILEVALIGASFCKSTPQLLATQGFLYGVGGAIHYFPAFLYIDEWFIARRGFAYGIVWAGGALAGAVVPLVMEALLRNYGFRTALRAWVVFSTLATLPALCFMKGRLPVQHASTGPQKLELGFLKSATFWLLESGTIIQGLGFFMPALYLQSFAQSIGLSALSGTIAISLMNATMVAGATFWGFLVDRCHVTTVINFCAIGTALACLVFWSFAVNLPILLIFAIMYGFFAGGFGSTWAGIAVPLRRQYPAVETGMIIAMMSAGKGLGSVVSGPVSGAMVRSDMWKHKLSFAYGSGYGSLIIFSGVTASVQMMGWVGKKCGIV